MSTAGNLQRMAMTAGADRNRVVDLVRAFALCAVVLGHWLKQGLYVDSNGLLHRAGLLGLETWTHPLTWLFQVMPLFFLVGGFANATSWRHARDNGHTYGIWLRARVTRLTDPLLPLLGFWAVAAVVATSLDLSNRWLYVGSDTALVATWFLATYLFIVAIVPLTHRAWELWGRSTLVVGMTGAALVDVASILTGNATLGALNLLFVWGSLHQFGYLWLDRKAPRRRVTAVLGLGCLLLLTCLVWLGPYGISMVGVSGYGLNNTHPPRVTILLLGGAQVAVILVLEPILKRVAETVWLWRLIVAVEARTMTIYLWHMTVLAALAAVSVCFGGLGLHPAPASAGWWYVRPVWLAVLTLCTAMVVALVGRWEDPRPRLPGQTTATLPLIRVALTCGALAAMATLSLAPDDSGQPRWPIAAGAFVSLTLLSRLDQRIAQG